LVVIVVSSFQGGLHANGRQQQMDEELMFDKKELKSQ
jgi:hypothetical protein